MPLIRLNARPSKGSLRTFGALSLVFLAAIGVHAWRGGGHGAASLLLAAGALAGALAAFRPKWLRPAYLAASYASYPIGYAVSFVVLTGAFYLLFTPAGILLRLCGHDALSRRWDRTRKSYWEPRTGPKPAKSYFYQS